VRYHCYAPQQIQREKRELTSGLEPLSCSLRVITHVLQRFA
jgi:hypothetical protein